MVIGMVRGRAMMACHRSLVNAGGSNARDAGLSFVRGARPLSGSSVGGESGPPEAAQAAQAAQAALRAAKSRSGGPTGRAPVEYERLEDKLSVLQTADGPHVQAVEQALAEDEQEGRLLQPAGDAQAWQAHAEDYKLLVAAVQEKLRLTVDWNDTAKMTEKERVRATANRVGLSTYETPEGQ